MTFETFRGKHLPPLVERRLHIAVADLMRRTGRPEWWWSHIPSGELRTEETGALLKRMGMRAGMFDFLLIDSVGRHHWLELKRGPAAGLSLAQIDFRTMLQTRGVPYAVAHGFDEAVASLDGWGVLRPLKVQ